MDDASVIPAASVYKSLAAPLAAPPRRRGKVPAESMDEMITGTESFEDRLHVGSAQYVRTVVAPMRKKAPVDLEGVASRRFKTERWRESGEPRWPCHAKEEIQRRPFQFAKNEGMVPLQRTTENPQEHIADEIWTRSLREESLIRQHIAPYNGNVATTSLSVTFDRKGRGWTGSTNMRPLPDRPPTREWVLRPVAVGNMSLDHMGGSRYEVRTTPRPCVPDSMHHVVVSPPASSKPPICRQQSPRTAPKTAR
mmetsp:Transcript_73830/g.205317  ORF Transcript_73830/g.205317 Transcript_73830/m.205317 type:complete len:252 (+) Transcript_73830:76-831(+)